MHIKVYMSIEIDVFLNNGFAKEEVASIILNMPNYKYIETELTKIFEEENYD